MNVKFSIYDDTGRVLFGGEVPESMLSLQEGNVYVGEVDGLTHYIVAGKRMARPANPATMSGQQLNNLPVPCTIQINGKQYPCTDDHANLNFTYPGRYQIRVAAFPYLDAQFELNL